MRRDGLGLFLPHAARRMAFLSRAGFDSVLTHTELGTETAADSVRDPGAMSPVWPPAIPCAPLPWVRWMRAGPSGRVAPAVRLGDSDADTGRLWLRGQLGGVMEAPWGG
jgi:hypothetical protein